MIAPSISLPNSVWAVLLHPGAVNTSGLILAVVTALNRIMGRRHEVEKATARALAQEEGASASKEEPPRRQCLAGGGSLAATGRVPQAFFFSFVLLFLRSANVLTAEPRSCGVG